jgi:O-acetyl-ADP-ribose deacetylase (regulator of RNase III)
VTKVRTVVGDITEQQVDAMVNAANEGMLGGLGVDGAIHRAAGKSLRKRCLEVPEVRTGVRCPTGEARITDGCNLPAKFVIHTVGPRYTMPDAPRLLANAFRAALQIASEHPDIRTLAFPAVSCGTYGYPLREAAAIAAAVIAERRWDLDEIRFVLLSEQDRATFAMALCG